MLRKLHRAYQQLEEIQCVILDFLDGEDQPYSIDIEQHSWEEGDQRGPEFVFVARVLREPPVELLLLIGEFLYNLRSALDHLAYRFATPVNGAPPDGTEFPIFRYGSSYRGENSPTRKKPRKARAAGSSPPARSGLYKVRGMPGLVGAAIEGLQPYNTVDPDLDPLWLLHTLNIEDKHRTLNLVGAALIEPRLTVHIHSPGIQLLPGWEIHSGPFEDGAVVAQCRALVTANYRHYIGTTPEGRPAPENDMEVGLSRSFHVAFAPDGPGKGQPVAASCGRMYNTVREVFVALDPFLGLH